MHLYLFLRGNLPVVEMWKTLIQGQFFKFKRINLKTNKEETKFVQAALRPSVFGAYEIVIPENALPDLLSMIGVFSDGIPSYDLNTPLKQFKGKMKMALIRKMFGCKKIPKEIYEKALIAPPSIEVIGCERGLSSCRIPGVAFHIIGIKKDRYSEFRHPVEAPDGYFQEMI